MPQFDQKRRDFAPYGFTCERWLPTLMPRSDRHNEIELNLLEQGALTYLLGGATLPFQRDNWRSSGPVFPTKSSASRASASISS